MIRLAIISLLAFAAPASAEDTYIVFSVDNSGEPAVHGFGVSTDRFEAIKLANADCVENGGSDCSSWRTGKNNCMAMTIEADLTKGGWGGHFGDTTEEATDKALLECGHPKYSECIVVEARCALEN